jgi:hypothetical protein
MEAVLTDDKNSAPENRMPDGLSIWNSDEKDMAATVRSTWRLTQQQPPI